MAWELIGGIHFHTVAHIDLHEFGGVLDLFELDGLEVCYSDWVTILPLGKNLHPSQSVDSDHLLLPRTRPQDVTNRECQVFTTLALSSPLIRRWGQRSLAASCIPIKQDAVHCALWDVLSAIPVLNEGHGDEAGSKHLGDFGLS